jgi:hypothetical protein
MVSLLILGHRQTDRQTDRCLHITYSFLLYFVKNTLRSCTYLSCTNFCSVGTCLELSISLDLNKTFHSKPPSSYTCDWSHKYMSHVVKPWVYVTHLLYFTSLLTVAFTVMTPFNWAIFLENGGSTSI